MVGAEVVYNDNLSCDDGRESGSSIRDACRDEWGAVVASEFGEECRDVALDGADNAQRRFASAG